MNCFEINQSLKPLKLELQLLIKWEELVRDSVDQIQLASRPARMNRRAEIIGKMVELRRACVTRLGGCQRTGRCEMRDIFSDLDQARLAYQQIREETANRGN